MKGSRNIVCLLLTLLIGLYAAVPAAAEENPPPEEETEQQQDITAVMLFGDSIASGYGMPGYTSGDPSKVVGSFAALLAEYYHLRYGEGIFNSAVTGYDSTHTLSSIRKADTARLKEAEMIVIAVGSNDMMNVLSETAFRVYGSMAQELRDNGITIDVSDLNRLEQTLLNLMNDSSQKALLDRFIQECTTDQVKTRCQNAALKCESNIKEMISYLREIGSQAEIFLLTPYNPTVVLRQNALTDMVQHTAEGIQKAFLDVSNSHEYGYRVNVIDLLTDFSKDYHALTKIDTLDIHPSAAGHQLIADTIIRRMNLLIKQHQAEAAEQQHRTAPVSNLWVYLLFIAAGLCVIAIIIYAVWIRRKK